MSSEASQDSADETPPETSAGPPLDGHAQRLAEWLDTRRRELDHREAMLATRESDLEEKVDSARQWLEGERERLDQRADELQAPEAGAATAPQQEEIAERVAELDARQASLNREAEALAEGKASLAARSDTLDAREADLAQRLRDAEKTDQATTQRAREVQDRADALDRRQQELEVLHAETAALSEEAADRERSLELRAREIETAVQRFAHLGAAEQRIEELQAKVLRAAERESALAETEALLQEERAALSEAQQQHARCQGEHDRRMEAERRAWGSDQAAWRAEMKSAADAQSRRETDLDRRDESLRRLEREIQAAQREVLEMRLATEETWAQLTGLLTPAALSKSIAKVRVQLADHYQNTLRDIAEGRGALRDAAARVEQEMRVLEQRQISVEEWASRRHDEIGQAAARVEGREQELTRQQRAFEQHEARWAAERTAYREQILKLRGAIDRDEPLAKAA